MKATSTKYPFLSAGLAALVLSLLAGCITPFRPPADVAHLRLTTQDSADVAVIKVWLERPANSPLVVTGYVLRKLGASDPRDSRLAIEIRDVAGKTLQTREVYYEPRVLPHRPRPTENTGHYRHVLDPLPAGAAEIVIRVVDAEASGAH